ncbi:hypothetical protein RO575_22420 [Methylomonas sp. MO1]|uniref:hypothetical protein n=1 Tax=Methylomonas sp. MO1 TaxID=3073619 RepID=UPI0028A47FB1|nr:hypothetical protein [Methylomonas sp. MO1]MDT4292330.1 hypothetical protein [Methylomonas sp. MO1]
MSKEAKSPRTFRDAFAAQVLGDIDTLLDKVEAVNGSVNAATEKMQQTIIEFEKAGETYNQAVLAANMRSKNEMVAFLQTATNSTVAKTKDEQRELIQELIREAVLAELATRKQVLLSSKTRPMLVQWFMILAICIVTALISSVATIELLHNIQP